MTRTALVIGGGPAGLMAAEVLSAEGVAVTIVDRMPSLGRKFLMAGKSGLNLTKDEPRDAFLAHFAEPMRGIVADFDARAVMNWAEGLGQPLFTGSTGRVFPVAMKASPLLRAWLARLAERNVKILTRYRWTGFDGAAAVFETGDGEDRIMADVTILAMGGASWQRLGADGAWAEVLDATAPFQPANCGFAVDWSPYMTPHIGQPIKATTLTAGPLHSRGEWVITAAGIEGGGIYEVSAAVRDGAPLRVDLCPDLSVGEIARRIAGRNSKKSWTVFLSRQLNLSPPKVALVNELKPHADQSDPATVAARLKALTLPCTAPLPLDQAISTAGGLRFAALTEDLMFRDSPGTFAAGEMLDWEAITGGYLLTGCLASGHRAAEGALRYLTSREGA